VPCTVWRVVWLGFVALVLQKARFTTLCSKSAINNLVLQKVRFITLCRHRQRPQHLTPTPRPPTHPPNRPPPVMTTSPAPPSATAISTSSARSAPWSAAGWMACPRRCWMTTPRSRPTATRLRHTPRWVDGMGLALGFVLGLVLGLRGSVG